MSGPAPRRRALFVRAHRSPQRRGRISLTGGYGRISARWQPLTALEFIAMAGWPVWWRLAYRQRAEQAPFAWIGIGQRFAASIDGPDAPAEICVIDARPHDHREGARHRRHLLRRRDQPALLTRMYHSTRRRTWRRVYPRAITPPTNSPSFFSPSVPFSFP